MALENEETVDQDSGAAPAIAERLVDRIRPLEAVVVAFSGGVDSAVVAAAAYRAVGDRALAVTALSPSVADTQREWAVKAVQEIGIRHQFVHTGEVTRDDYRANDLRRCYWCKQTLYGALVEIARREGAGRDSVPAILSGTNADDLRDYRPGIAAGTEAGVRTPLAELGIGKEDVRRLARHWGLSVWDLPAAPCLASRVAYGVEVTAERLRRIERAEAWLRDHGCRELRVRLHEGELARVELPAAEIARFASPELAPRLVAYFQQLGFRFVTLDLAGLRSGSLNALIQIQPARVTEDRSTHE